MAAGQISVRIGSRPAGRLADWPVSRLVGWQAGWLADWLKSLEIQGFWVYLGSLIHVGMAGHGQGCDQKGVP